LPFLEQVALEFSGHTNKNGSLWKLVHTLQYSRAQTPPSWRGEGVWLQYDIPPDPRGA